MKQANFKQKRNVRIIFRMLLLLAVSVFTQGIYAQVTIGAGIEPAKGALLDIKEYDATTDDNETATKGLLHPRVKLTDRNELYPMYGTMDAESPEYSGNKNDLKKKHKGLVVFNVTNGGDFVPGLHIWDGSEWRRLEDSPLINPQITSLVCGSSSIISNSYTAGVPYEGLLNIPYLGGNGGVYGGTDSVSIGNGLFIERLSGKLAIGGSEVMFRVHGTPTVSSPATTTFPVEFLGDTCNISIGSGNVTSLYIKNLTADVSINIQYTDVNSFSSAVILPFEEIIIPETGSYAFSVRLYGNLPGASTTTTVRHPFYIYLQRNDRGDLHDSAEIDIVTAPQAATYQDYSYSITLGGTFSTGDRVIISMNKPNGGTNWNLKKGSETNRMSPARTSLIYWKL